MQHPNPADHPNHFLHDATLVAGHAAGDLTASELARAQELIDSCVPCADLHGDLIAIAIATRALPNLATAPRDFRLDEAEAARLRRRSWLWSLLAPFGSSGRAARPMATAFTTLGLAGLLVATVMPGLFGSVASMSMERVQSGAGAAVATGAPEQPLGAAGQPTAPAPNGPGTGVDSGATAGSEGGEVGSKGGNEGVTPSGAREAGDTERTWDFGPLTALLLGSIALLAIGLALFALRFAARRLRA